MVTDQNILITTGGGVLIAVITQTPAIMREVRGTAKAEEDRALALEAVAAKNKELDALRKVLEERDGTISTQAARLAAYERRVALLETELEWHHEHCPRPPTEGEATT